jgi:hypothetical protein
MLNRTKRHTAECMADNKIIDAWHFCTSPASLKARLVTSFHHLPRTENAARASKPRELTPLASCYQSSDAL